MFCLFKNFTSAEILLGDCSICHHSARRLVQSFLSAGVDASLVDHASVCRLPWCTAVAHRTFCCKESLAALNEIYKVLELARHHVYTRQTNGSNERTPHLIGGAIGWLLMKDEDHALLSTLGVKKLWFGHFPKQTLHIEPIVHIQRERQSAYNFFKISSVNGEPFLRFSCVTALPK